MHTEGLHVQRPEGLLTGVHYSTEAADVSLTYDGYGRRSQMTAGAGTQTYAYDDEDNPLSVSTTYTGLPTKSITYGYWPDGSRQSMGTPAGAFSYAYDAAGRMTGLTNPYNETSGWVYLDNGWLWKQTLGDGATATYTYNALGQTTDLVNRTSAGALLSEFATPNQGGYDGAGNRTALAASLPAAPAGYSGTTAYGYDAKDQLVSEQSTRLNGYTNGFGYDGAGNTTTFRGAAHAFNSDNQDSTGLYDGDGNPQSRQSNTLTFDSVSRLTGYGSLLTVGYNGNSLRAWKQSAGTRTYFLYDGGTTVCELDSSGTTTAVNTFGADGLLSRKTSAGSAFYTFDLSGNVAQRLDGTGNVLSSDAYDAFGSQVSTGGSDVFGYGAQWGYYMDAETGLVLCTHRYYDPQRGRWLTRDPMSYGGGVNLYGYSGNNPVNFADPSGLSVWGIVTGGVTTIGIIGGVILLGGVAAVSAPVLLVGIGVGAIAGTVAGHYGDGSDWGPASADGLMGATIIGDLTPPTLGRIGDEMKIRPGTIYGDPHFVYGVGEDYEHAVQRPNDPGPMTIKPMDRAYGRIFKPSPVTIHIPVKHPDKVLNPGGKATNCATAAAAGVRRGIIGR